MAALAIAVPAASASDATQSTTHKAAGSESSQVWGCPTWYGFSNPANGCEPWVLYFEGIEGQFFQPFPFVR